MTRVIRPAASYDDDLDDLPPARAGRGAPPKGDGGDRAAGPDHSYMGLPMRAFALALAHPMPALGVVASAAIVIAVAANAIGNQPGHHPSPFFATRPFADTPAPVVARAPEAPAQAAAINAVKPPAKPAIAHDGADPALQTGALASAQPRQKPAAGPEPSQLLRDLQILMGARGLYRGEIDGLSSPGTTDALKALERSLGLVQTGEASERLLAIAREKTLAVPVPPKAAEKPEAKAQPVPPQGLAAPALPEKRAVPVQAQPAPVPPMPIGKTAVPVVQPQGKVAIPVVARPAPQALAKPAPTPVAVAKPAPVAVAKPAAPVKPVAHAVPVQQAQAAVVKKDASIDALIGAAQ